MTRSGQGPFVDTGVDIGFRPELRGRTERLYLSVDTIRYLAQVAGLTEQAATPEREEQLIAKGKLEGLKEGLGGDIDVVASTLRRWLDSLDGVSGD